MAVFCLLCAKRFQTQKALQQHMEVHAGMHSYICSHCERPFPSHTTLKRHLRSHTGKGRMVRTARRHPRRYLLWREKKHAYVGKRGLDLFLYMG